MDASTGHGVGLLWKYQWYFWETREDWRGSPGEGRNISWLEAVGIEMAIRLISLHSIHDADLLIRSDNEGAIHTFRKGCSRNHMVNACIKRTEAILAEHNLSITLLYVPSESNLADPISRGIFPNITLHIVSPPSLPNDISRWFQHAR